MYLAKNLDISKFKKFKHRFPEKDLLDELDTVLVNSVPGKHLGFDEFENVDFMSAMLTMPHTDAEYWKGRYFVTLCVKSSGYVFDEVGTDIHRDQNISEGDLFIVDPMNLHWLFPRKATKKVCHLVQWNVYKKDLKETVAKVVERLGGEWLPLNRIEKKYRKYRPIGV
jgi:hypothetical protein